MPSHGEKKSPGKLYIVGIGPGSQGQITGDATKAIRDSEVIIGNAAYLDQIAGLTSGKRVIRSSMGHEVERAREAVGLASRSRVAMVSGGDPGVYGMAGIVLEVVDNMGSSIPVEVIPGVTAATAAAALVGSPLSGDFAVVSLSDLLTPWEVIEHRLRAVVRAGMPLVLYNPRSRTRSANFGRAMKIVLDILPDSTPMALVRHAYREGEQVITLTAGDWETVEEQVDMHTVVIIGSEETRFWRNGNETRGIITPRGYHRKYVY